MAGAMARGQASPSHVEKFGPTRGRCSLMLVAADELMAAAVGLCPKLCALDTANSTDYENPKCYNVWLHDDVRSKCRTNDRFSIPRRL